MKEIVSKKTGHSEIISDEKWEEIIEQGFEKRFTVSEIKELKLKSIPIIPSEIKTKTKKVNG